MLGDQLGTGFKDALAREMPVCHLLEVCRQGVFSWSRVEAISWSWGMAIAIDV